MANWSNPVLTSTYTDFMNQLKDRDTDLALQFDGTTSTNLATGTVRWDSTAGRWKKWNGSSWAELAATYALTALSTTGNATIGGTLSVTGSTALAAATATTPATGDNNTNVATTAFVKAQNYAPLASPTLTGTPAAPTATTGDNTTQIATTAFVNAEIANDAVLKSGATMTGALTLSGDPTSDLHAVPRQWVQSLAPKQACRVATTANITLSGTQTIDGIALSIGDRVLVKDQTTTNQNGIYEVASGAWSRAADADVWNDLIGARTTISQGTTNDNTFWMSTTAAGGTLGTTPITWVQVVTNTGSIRLSVPDGSEAAPAVSFLNSGGDTGLYSPGADQAAISTGGTGRLFVNASGNTGVGATPSTTTRLEVSRLGGAWTGPAQQSGTALTLHPGTASTGSPASIQMFSGNAASSSIFFGDSDSNLSGYIQYDHSTDALKIAANGAERLFVNSSGRVGIATASPAVTLDVSATDAVRVAAGTTAQRPSGAAGMIRYNSTLTQFEGHNGTAWGSLGGGATGGGSDQVFIENGQTVTTNYTLGTNKNAVSAGPVTVNAGVTVTVPAGASWVIV